MIIIDGSRGEGGGQILRTSLALSLITGKPFQVNKIRAGRKKSGLMRQHLTALNAAREIGEARVSGNSIGSSSFSFAPATLKAGNYQFAIGTAGSCTLVLQAVLPALILADGPSTLVLEGGTHNPNSPSYDFLVKVFLPLLSQMGPKVKATLERPGFYPAGGGRFSVQIEPVKDLKPIEILQRGKAIRQKAVATISQLEPNIAKRELKVVRRKLNWPDNCLEIKEIKNSRGPGNVLTLEVKYENITELFIGFGERGVSAEKVASKTAKLATDYLKSDAPVGRYLADQLLIPMALAGKGRFRTLSLTNHTLTNMDIIQRFLDVNFEVDNISDGTVEINISS